MHARQNRGPVAVNSFQQQPQDQVPMEVEPVPQPQVEQRKVGRWGSSTKKTTTTTSKTTTSNQSQVMISEMDPKEEGCVSNGMDRWIKDLERSWLDSFPFDAHLD